MRFRAITALSVLGVFATACASAPKHDTTADTAAIATVRNNYMAAFKAGDAAKMASLYTSDAIGMTAGQPSTTDAQGLQAGSKGMLDMMSGQEMVLTPTKTEVSGDMAYDAGTYHLTANMKGGGAMTEDGRYLVVLKRQTDGSWKLAADMNNLPTQPAPMPMTEPGKMDHSKMSAPPQKKGGK
ncbi:MAG TPA: nuclear transport factor 2 family protein [Gemmatimonadaceae bacterium]|nr:nuclear transport factor 2 family protein [Gemmatimonadaceae bacterium]